MNDPQPICPRCGLYLVVRGCTAETCANPEGADELERLRVAGGDMTTTDGTTTITTPWIQVPRSNKVGPR